MVLLYVRSKKSLEKTYITKELAGYKPVTAANFKKKLFRKVQVFDINY